MRLLELCKALDLFIANGRVSSDALIGKATCKNVSVVDYAVCSANVLKSITDSYENIDRIITHTHTVSQLLTHKQEPTKPKWKPDLAEDFTQLLVESDINHILDTLHNLSDKPCTQGAINNVFGQISSLFRTVACELSMLPRANKQQTYNKTRARHYPHKAWYNQECELKRNEYMQLKKQYIQQKNNLDLIHQAGRDYKNEINTAFRKY